MSSQSANAALRRMGYQGVLVSHGLRAIFSTAANEEGFEPDVIEAALAHIDTNEVRRAYNRSNYLEKRIVLMCWWGNLSKQLQQESRWQQVREGLGLYSINPVTEGECCMKNQ
ncbi:integrase [Klebsiella pneumoniae]|uniref:Integrase n=1 Tax=Klebsiella pneumoniae TaxID=573 RepID=A0A377XN47_KLEPN|nr:integrase [Klebsiella pneumoniae]